MARVRIFGSEISADVVEKRDGGYVMIARSANPRVSIGGQFFAKQSEVIEMSAAEAPAEGESNGKI